MFSFLRLLLGRLVLGMLSSLLMFVIGRAMKSILASQTAPTRAPASPHWGTTTPSPSATPYPATQQPSAPSVIIHDTIWQGMSQNDLIAAYGHPTARQSAQDGREIWIYQNSASNDNDDNPSGEMTVTLDHGRVSGWTD